MQTTQINKWLSVFSALVIALGLSACTTTPVNPQSSTAEQRQQLQQARFAEGKNLFLRKQYPEAAAIFLPLARQGHVDAQYTIGYMYHYGYGVPRNEKESTRWIATAAARGHPQAQTALQRINALHKQQGVETAPADNPGVRILTPPTLSE